MAGQRGTGAAGNAGHLLRESSRSRVTRNTGDTITVCSMPLPIVAPPGGSAGGRPAPRPAGLEFMAPRARDVPLACRPAAINLDLVPSHRGPARGRHVLRDPLELKLGVRHETNSSSDTEEKLASCVLPHMPPAVHCGMAAITRQPFIRRGLDPGRLTAGERNGYLLEAERHRNIKPDCGTVLAVFRRIPIELVSKIRFDERRHLLAYTLVSLRGINKSRIHDLAAVKDAASGRIFLIPQRTRFQMAALP